MVKDFLVSLIGSQMISSKNFFKKEKLLQLRLDPQPDNLHMPWEQPKKWQKDQKKKKKKERNYLEYCTNEYENNCLWTYDSFHKNEENTT